MVSFGREIMMSNMQRLPLQGQLSRIQIEEGLDTEEGVGFDRIGDFNENFYYKHNFISHKLMRKTTVKKTKIS